MKPIHLHHLVWAIIAITAFVFGSRLTPSDETDPASSSKSSSSRLSSSERSPTQSRDESKRPKSSRRTSSNSAKSAILTESDIAQLGNTFKNGNLVERRLAFAEMLKNLTPENALLMREQIADLPQDSSEFREFHYAWGAIAGREAIAHGEETKKRDMAASLAGWASADPTSALAYFNSLSPEAQDSGSHMKWGAAFGLADANPYLAAEFAANRSQNGDRDASKMINIAAAAVLRSGDQNVATDWATQIPEGNLQNTAFQRLASEYAREDPAAAVEWAVDLPESEGKGHAVGSSFHQWAGRDPQEAADAIASIPAGDRDAATYGYATRIVQNDPAIGVEWAASISDPESRTSALIDTGRVFYQRDREAANAWLATSGLTQDQQQRITRGN